MKQNETIIIKETSRLENAANYRSDNHLSNKWYCVQLPLTDYLKAWDLQRRLVQARKYGSINQDILLLLEHPSVFTVGRNGGRENLRVSEAFLERIGTPLIQVERGGSITYHGPGQLIGYPIIDLNRFRLRVVDFVWKLEEVMIRAASTWGITAERNSKNRGIWVGNNKLGSIGVAVRRGVSFHGFALNINVSLEPFCWIHPCGLNSIGMTSFEKELSRPVSVPQVLETVKGCVEQVFNVRLISPQAPNITLILNDN
ncbi:MAG: lipoyl(octanoyl) transferase LipB [Deltaproteobacteria bacterium]|nr:lipoyl(octanoyl) transferase LipB [Deltaproteobacteria bacterium]MBW1992975.1 lipoyl(octanoyl) transferase LipB [Deltaproteobacteria bacterium]MBW2150445.1 lipoyl(octanoyl) transferase LipB [Deltaproteobacteria bacterium]